MDYKGAAFVIQSFLDHNKAVKIAARLPGSNDSISLGDLASALSPLLLQLCTDGSRERPVLPSDNEKKYRTWVNELGVVDVREGSESAISVAKQSYDERKSAAST